MEIFKGALHHRCALPGYEQSLADSTRRALHGGGSYDYQARVSAHFDSGIQCRMEPNTCPEQMACVDFDTNPNDGLLSFDSVGSASIVVLEAITGDTWSESMYAVMSSYSPYACIYFVTVAILGGMFVVNLFLAVIFEVRPKSCLR